MSKIRGLALFQLKINLSKGLSFIWMYEVLLYILNRHKITHLFTTAIIYDNGFNENDILIVLND